jgi:hypothetical protein
MICWSVERYRKSWTGWAFLERPTPPRAVVIGPQAEPLYLFPHILYDDPRREQGGKTIVAPLNHLPECPGDKADGLQLGPPCL